MGEEDETRYRKVIKVDLSGKKPFRFDDGDEEEAELIVSAKHREERYPWAGQSEQVRLAL